MNNNRFPPHKCGGTFSYAGVCQLPPGTWTASCQVRSVASNALVGTIVVTLGAPVGADTPIALYAHANDTALWSTGQHQLDIRYTDGSGTTMHTSTLLLPVVRAITEQS